MPEYTPLIASAFFEGPRTDVLTTTTGLLGIAAIILCIGLIMRIISR